MKKRQTDQKASQQAEDGSHKKYPVFGIFALCLMLGCGVAVSTIFLGTGIRRFIGRDENVIFLVPAEQVSAEAGNANAAGSSKAKSERSPAPAAPEKELMPQNTAGTAGHTAGTTDYTAVRSDGYRGDLQVSDDVRAWSSETRVDLFRSNYDGTAKSGDGEKIIAPGTSNFYDFTLKNNGNSPLDYSISLKVETNLGEQETYAEIPLEWRLLSGDGAAISDWQNYNERTEVLKQTTLDVRHQDRYTIEWRWPFERGGDMDGTDTGMGNLAVDKTLNAKATIIVYAEQNTEQSGGQNMSSDPRMQPKTGDTSNIVLYLALMAVSGCGLVLLVQGKRRRKKRK